MKSGKDTKKGRRIKGMFRISSSLRYGKDYGLKKVLQQGQDLTPAATSVNTLATENKSGVV
jgi:hypothetical protein